MLGTVHGHAHGADAMCSWLQDSTSGPRIAQQQFDLLPVLSAASASRLTARCATPAPGYFCSGTGCIVHIACAAVVLHRHRWYSCFVGCPRH
jgi:hypothetical protein